MVNEVKPLFVVGLYYNPRWLLIAMAVRRIYEEKGEAQTKYKMTEVVYMCRRTPPESVRTTDKNFRLFSMENPQMYPQIRNGSAKSARCTVMVGEQCELGWR